MSTRRAHLRSQHVATRTPSGRAWLGVLLLAGIAGLAVAVLLSQAVAPRGARPSVASAEAHVKGDPGAPVTLTEWGDFQ